MYKCSNCGATMEYPHNRCPSCHVLLSGVRCEGCGYTDTKHVFIENKNRCPKCGSVVNVDASYDGLSDSFGVEKSKRIGCLSAWLIFIIIGSIINVINISTSLLLTQTTSPLHSALFSQVGFISAVLNIIFAIALFKWKKYGFYGLCVTSIVSFIMNLYAGISLLPSLISFISVVILYILLKVGDERKAWPQLT